MRISGATAKILSAFFCLSFVLPLQLATAQAQKAAGRYEEKKRQTNDIAVSIIVSGLTCTCARFAEDIRNVEGIGPKIADSIYAYFRDPQKRAIIEKLRKADVNFDYRRPKRVEGPLSGESFVFTGTLASMPRGKAESLVASLGGESGNSVTRKTTYLVAGADPGSKIQKAESYGITMLDEDSFLRLLREHGVDAA